MTLSPGFASALPCAATLANSTPIDGRTIRDAREIRNAHADVRQVINEMGRV